MKKLNKCAKTLSLFHSMINYNWSIFYMFTISDTKTENNISFLEWYTSYHCIQSRSCIRYQY